MLKKQLSKQNEDEEVQIEEEVIEDHKERRSEVLDFNNPSYRFIPKGNHLWRQQGPYLMCKTCDLSHGVWVGMEKRLMGFTTNGEPILQKVKR